MDKRNDELTEYWLRKQFADNPERLEQILRSREKDLHSCRAQWSAGELLIFILMLPLLVLFWLVFNVIKCIDRYL
jgi:hypothetical protein